MNLFDALADGREDAAAASLIAGVVVGLVTNNQDPEGMGRVKVMFPWLSDEDESNWARVAAPMAGNGCGVYFLPDVGDEVLVAFEHGDVRFPYVVGALWNGEDQPPAANDDGENNVRVIRSRSGHVVQLTDTDGREKIEIIDKSEQNSIVFDTADNTITITSAKDIVLSAAQGTIRLEAKNVEIASSANTSIEAGGDINAAAAGHANVQGTTINLN